jgi:hypothetical protein
MSAALKKPAKFVGFSRSSMLVLHETVGPQLSPEAPISADVCDSYGILELSPPQTLRSGGSNAFCLLKEGILDLCRPSCVRECQHFLELRMFLEIPLSWGIGVSLDSNNANYMGSEFELFSSLWWSRGFGSTRSLPHIAENIRCFKLGEHGRISLGSAKDLKLKEGPQSLRNYDFIASGLTDRAFIWTRESN